MDPAALCLALASVILPAGPAASAADPGMPPAPDPAPILRGTDADETLRAGGDDTHLLGDRGDDVLEGGTGRDTYHYRLGDGRDVILGMTGDERIVLHQVQPSQVERTMLGEDLLLTIRASATGRDLGSIRIVAPPTGPDVRIDHEVRPNVILVMADDLGYGHLGCYGQAIIRTPRIDAMAAEGMRFTQFYAGAGICAPSRSSLLEGLHTGRAYARCFVAFEDELELFPERLRDDGYRTGVFGKWGMARRTASGRILWGGPAEAGFDDGVFFISHPDAHLHYPAWRAPDCESATPKAPWWDPAVIMDRLATLDTDEVTRPLGEKDYAHDVFMDEALRFIDESVGEPFFLYLPLTIPHAEIQPPPGGIDPAYLAALAEFDAEDPHTPELTCNSASYQRHNLHPYSTLATMISRLDQDMGTLIDAVRSRGLEGNTVIIFLSDNGPAGAGGPSNQSVFDGAGGLRGQKSRLYEGGIRVPMIAWGPGRVQAGAVCDVPAAIWDLAPTIASITETPTDDDWDGVSLEGLLGGDEQMIEPRHLYWEFGIGGEIQAVRLGDWKAIRKSDDALELYDLGNDPFELVDRAADEPCAHVLETLKRLMNESHEFAEHCSDDYDFDPLPVETPACMADLNADELVGGPDLLEVLAAWGEVTCSPADLDLSGRVDTVDLLAVLNAWGPCP